MPGRRAAFTVPGEPKGKGRARAVPGIKHGPDGEPEAFVRLVTPEDTRRAEARVRAAFLLAHPGHQPFTGPVLLNFTAVFEIPASFNEALRAAALRGDLYAVKKPDKDNIEKLLVDALNQVAFVDDQQVMGGGVKRYGSPARIDVSLRQLDSPDTPPTPGQKRVEARIAGQKRLQADRAACANPSKSGSGKAAQAPRTPTQPAEPPDKGVTPAQALASYGPKARALIEAALARDEAAKRKPRR